MYDLIRDSDDDDENEMPKPNTRLSSKNKAMAKANSSNQQTIVIGSSFEASPSPSPRPSEKQAAKRQEEPLNLVSASQMASLKKKTSPTSVSNSQVENDLEAVLSGLKAEEFKNQVQKLKLLFPNSIVLVIENLISFLNTRLLQIPDMEPQTDKPADTSRKKFI